MEKASGRDSPLRQAMVVEKASSKDSPLQQGAGKSSWIFPISRR
jgi:hypothetical protein